MSRLSPLREKRKQQLCRLRRAEAAVKLRYVVAGRLAERARAVLDAARKFERAMYRAASRIDQPVSVIVAADSCRDATAARAMLAPVSLPRLVVEGTWRSAGAVLPGLPSPTG